MFMLWVFGILIVFLFAMLIVSLNYSKKKREKLQSRNAISFFSAIHVEGLNITKNSPVDILQFHDRIQLESGNQKYQIPIENLKVAVIKSEREILEKNKSVVGRAMIGTVLVPGIGTIVGGMSGIGKKTVKGNVNNFLILNYVNSQGDLAAVTFLNDPLQISKAYDFCNSMNNQITAITGQEAVTL